MSQDRGFFENLARKFLLPEEGDVQNFLAHSDEFRIMKEIAQTASSTSFTNGHPDPAQELTTVNDIAKAVTFSEILNSTSRLNFHHQPAIGYGAKLVFFVGGYVNQQLNFAYYALQLREKAEKTMTEKGYTYLQADRPRGSFV